MIKKRNNSPNSLSTLKQNYSTLKHYLKKINHIILFKKGQIECNTRIYFTKDTLSVCKAIG